MAAFFPETHSARLSGNWQNRLPGSSSMTPDCSLLKNIRPDLSFHLKLSGFSP